MLALIGGRIRAARTSRGMTLQTLGNSTNLTVSMLSLVERGRAAPSIGSLILIANALGVPMSDLVPSSTPDDQDVVVRAGSRPVVESSEKLLRTILRNDRTNGILISLTVYKPGTGASSIPRGHAGSEHGYVLEGELTVELDGTVYRLREGDLISYNSTRAHRIWNYSRRDAKALWFNVQNGHSPGASFAELRGPRRARSAPKRK
jgi:transcriptional regulator with XRE-family HTH domain